MRILDRYIIKQFVMNFIILGVVLGGLYVLVDLIIDLDEFLKAGRKHAGQRGGVVLATLWVMFDYYGPILLLIYSAMSGLLVVAAMGFTISQLQRNRELTAILASGLSLYRVAAPVLIAGFLLNLLVLPVQEVAIPPLSEKLVRSKSDVGNPTIHEKPVYYAIDDAGSLISASAFSAERGELKQVRIIERNSEGEQTRLIRAEKASWSGGDGAWRFEDGQVYTVPETTDTVLATLGGKPIDLYPTELSPEVLITRQAALFVRLQSLRQLQSMRSNTALSLQQRGKITQIMWSRFTTLVLGVLILLMGLPFFLTRVPGNQLINSAKAAGVTVGAWSAGLVLVQVGGLNAVTAAILPVVLFVPVAFYLITTIKT